MKKVKFALVMKDGAEARTLEELREVFDLESVIGYLLDGRLGRWLEGRNYEAEGKAVAALSREGQDVGEKLCRIFQVPYDREKWETIKARQEIGKLAMEYMENTDILGKISKLLGEKEPGKMEEELASGTVSPQCVVSQILKDNRELYEYGSAKEIAADLLSDATNQLGKDGITMDEIASELINRLMGSYPKLAEFAREFVSGKFDDLLADNRARNSNPQPIATPDPEDPLRLIKQVPLSKVGGDPDTLMSDAEEFAKYVSDPVVILRLAYSPCHECRKMMILDFSLTADNVDEYISLINLYFPVSKSAEALLRLRPYDPELNKEYVDRALSEARAVGGRLVREFKLVV